MAAVRMTLVLVVTLTLVMTSQACYCSLRHPQEIFCASDFVVRLEVMEVEEIYGNEVPRYAFPMEVRYTVDISYVFKGSEQYSNADHTYLVTGGSEGTCRQHLELGTAYVVMGRVYDGQMYFGLCDWTTKQADLTFHQSRGLLYKYRKGCNCEIQRCIGDECNVPGNRNNTCQWAYNNECDRSYGFCTENPGTGCAWRQNRMRRGCLSSLNNA